MSPDILVIPVGEPPTPLRELLLERGIFMAREVADQVVAIGRRASATLLEVLGGAGTPGSRRGRLPVECITGAAAILLGAICEPDALEPLKRLLLQEWVEETPIGYPAMLARALSRLGSPGVRALYEVAASEADDFNRSYAAAELGFCESEVVTGWLVQLFAREQSSVVCDELARGLCTRRHPDADRLVSQAFRDDRLDLLTKEELDGWLDTGACLLDEDHRDELTWFQPAHRAALQHVEYCLYCYEELHPAELDADVFKHYVLHSGGRPTQADIAVGQGRFEGYLRTGHLAHAWLRCQRDLQERFPPGIIAERFDTMLRVQPQVLWSAAAMAEIMDVANASLILPALERALATASDDQHRSHGDLTFCPSWVLHRYRQDIQAGQPLLYWQTKLMEISAQ